MLVALMQDEFDPYRPMAAALVDDPAPQEELPYHGPFSLGAVVGETVRLLKRHLAWGAALLLLPELGNATINLLESLGGEQATYQSAATLISFFVSGPLAIGALGALNWRIAGSAIEGPLERGPFAALFYGFRFFGVLFLWGMAIAGVAICFMIVPTVLFFALVFDASGAPALASEPVGWAAVIGASAIAGIGLLAVLGRWAVAIPIAFAEGRPIGAALKASANLVRGRLLAVCGLLLLLGLLTTGAALGVDLLAKVVIEHDRDAFEWVAYPGALGYLAVSLVAGVLSVAGSVGLYRVLRASATESAP
jgi:hypothetical protein